MVTRRVTAAFVVVSVVTFVVAVICTRLIMGGDSIVAGVMDATKTNGFIRESFGDNIQIARSRAGDRVHLELNGDRSGYFSFKISGTKKTAEVRVDWSKESTNEIQITQIWQVEMFKDNKLLWP